MWKLTCPFCYGRCPRNGVCWHFCCNHRVQNWPFHLQFFPSNHATPAWPYPFKNISVTSVVVFEEEVVYDQNPYFVFGSIQKPKPKKEDTFWPKPVTVNIKRLLYLLPSSGISIVWRADTWRRRHASPQLSALQTMEMPLIRLTLKFTDTGALFFFL